MRDVISKCPYICENKSASGYCKTTACVNPLYSNIGTTQYGQGVQKRIVTNADRVRNMDDYDLAIFLENVSCKHADTESWLDWLRKEVEP